MGENKLVPSSGTYLCSMQGNMCRISTLGGRSPPGKKGHQAAKDIKNGSTWLDMSVIADFTTLGESHIVWPSLVPLQTHYPLWTTLYLLMLP